MVYSVEQNTFIIVFYFRNGRFSNGKLSVCKNELLQLHLYKISVVQELQPADYQSCV
jgi:hypothetical protein